MAVSILHGRAFWLRCLFWPQIAWIWADQGWVAGTAAKATAAKLGPGKAKKLHRGFEKLLACGGVWETAKGRGRAVTTAPHWIWEGLTSYDPDAAELAVEAADMASCARYFTVCPVHCQDLCSFSLHASHKWSLGHGLGRFAEALEA